MATLLQCHHFLCSVNMREYILFAFVIMRTLRRKSVKVLYIYICIGIIIYLIYFRDQSIRNEGKNPIDIQTAYFPDSKVTIVSTKWDWHDYVQQQKEAMREGKGEHGSPATLNPGTEHLKDSIWLLNGFNGLLSDQIALDRSLKDIRHEKCRDLRYNYLLPSVSVVIPFFEEHLSALQRTVVSVISRSPAKLIKEIILVDDGSSQKVELQGDLDLWAQKYPLMKIVRLPDRVGLIAARLAGIRKATADVVVVLDSHCEVMVGWLPPLLEPIVSDPHTVVCPLIDVINADDFRYSPQDDGGRGAFDWRFYYKRLPLFKQDIKNLPEPFENPVMNGGLFAVNRKFFWELGGYDEGIRIWGGEQYNLSFKIWLCGGRLLDAPCSRVGHIFRKGETKRPAAINAGDFISVNYKRLAVIWMDEFAEAIYRRKPKLRDVDAGVISNELAVRERLQCKPFKWFLEHVAPDLLETYPAFEPPDFANGTVKSIANPSLCIDTGGQQTGQLILYGCHGMETQFFALNYQHAVRVENGQFCWVDVLQPEENLELKHCPRDPTGIYQWRYDNNTHQIVNLKRGRCLEADFSQRKIWTKSCDTSKDLQKWEFSYVNSDLTS